MKKQKLILVILAIAVFSPFVLWYAAVPDSAVAYLIASRTENMGLQVEMKNFHKGPFLNFSADSISAAANGKPVLVLDDVRGHINPLGLFLLRLSMPFKTGLARGDVQGVYTYGLFSGQSRLLADIEDVQISDLPPVKGSVSGSLQASVTFEGDQRGGQGSFVFSLKNLSNFPYGFKNANGVLDITPAGIGVRSISLDSEEIYAKLKGNLENGVYNIRLEVTSSGSNPNPLLSRYQVSPGYYVIPLSGTLRQLL